LNNTNINNNINLNKLTSNLNRSKTIELNNLKLILPIVHELKLKDPDYPYIFKLGSPLLFSSPHSCRLDRMNRHKDKIVLHKKEK